MEINWYEILTGIGFDVLKAVIGILITWVLLQLKKKWGIQISDARRQQIDEIVMRAILWAEEMYGPKNGRVKLEAAAAAVISEVPEVGNTLKAEKLVHAMLPKAGLGRAIKKAQGSLSE